MAPSRVRIPPSPLAQRPPRLCAHPRRGGRAVECGGLENRYPSLGGSRVQIPPPPLLRPELAWLSGAPVYGAALGRPAESARIRLVGRPTVARLSHALRRAARTTGHSAGVSGSWRMLVRDTRRRARPPRPRSRA